MKKIIIPFFSIFLLIASSNAAEKSTNSENDSTHLSGTNIYVSDGGNFNKPPWQILKYDENGENPEVFIPQSEGLAWPQDILFLEEKNEVLISNLNSGRINRHNASTGKLINNFAKDISGPTRIKLGPDNLLYVLQWAGSGKVLRYKLDGTFVDEFTSVGVKQSIGLDWDSEGNLYISSFAVASVRKFDTDGNDIGIFINANLKGPTNITFDSNGNLLVNDWKGGAVVKFDSDGKFVKILVTGLKQVEGIDFYPNGDFIIGNGGTKEIKLFDRYGNFIKNKVSAGSGGLILPNGLRLRIIN